MVTSNEPGLYRAGEHGIRHENIMVCLPWGETEFGDWLCFETLTLCHFDTSAILPELLDAKSIKWLNEYNERVYDVLSPRLPEDTARWLYAKTRPISL